MSDEQRKFHKENCAKCKTAQRKLEENCAQLEHMQVLDFRRRACLFVGGLAITALVYIFFKYIFGYVAPFAIGFMIALALEKAVDRLAVIIGRICYRIFHKKPGLNKRRSVASGIIMTGITLIIVGVLGYVMYLGFSELRKFAVNFNEYSDMAVQKYTQVAGEVEQVLQLPAGKITEIIGQIQVESGEISDLPQKILSFLVTAGKNVGLGVGAAIIGLMSVVYLAPIIGKVRVWRKRSVFREEIKAIHVSLSRLVNVYFRVQLLILLLNSTICAVVLFIIGNSYGIVLGILIGLMDALPVLGTGTVLIPWALFELLGKNYFAAGILILGYIITYFLREIMESKCTGDRVGISSFVMLVVIFVGFLVYGIWGFILGPASYCIARALVKCLYRELEAAGMGGG